MTADEMIRLLGLEPHPEGGAFCETWRSAREGAGRAAGTAIYYLLRAGERSHWHRLDVDEVWHFYAGAPLELVIGAEGQRVEHHMLGPDLADGHRPQRVVPAGAWQSARSTGAFTLVGCTMAPGFEYAGFELAPPDWQPTNLD